MRREGRMRGWVRVYDRELVDPGGKRRAAHVLDAAADGDGPAVVVANGGYVRASRIRPTNHSKPGGRRALDALCRKALAPEEEEEEEAPPATRYHHGYSAGSVPSYGYGYGYGYGAVAQRQARPVQPAAPAAAPSGGKGKGRAKAGRAFKHGKISKPYCLEEDELDYLYNYYS